MNWNISHKCLPYIQMEWNLAFIKYRNECLLLSIMILYLSPISACQKIFDSVDTKWFPSETNSWPNSYTVLFTKHVHACLSLRATFVMSVQLWYSSSQGMSNTFLWDYVLTLLNLLLRWRLGNHDVKWNRWENTDACTEERQQWFSSFIFPFKQSYLNGTYSTLVTVSSTAVEFQP